MAGDVKVAHVLILGPVAEASWSGRELRKEATEIEGRAHSVVNREPRSPSMHWFFVNHYSSLTNG